VREFADGTWSLVESVFKTGDYSAVNYFVSLNGAIGDGVHDDTVAIQNTLNKASRSGGGTVYVPNGKYRISSPITVPDNVSIVGDFVSPTSKKSSDEGTLFIIAESDSLLADSVFILSDNSSVSDFTVWYEGQTYGAIRQYPYTIRHASGKSASITNIAILNTYNGILAASSDCEKLFIENIYLTAFKNGVRIDECSDKLTMKGVSVSPVYWINDEKTEKAEGFDASVINDAVYSNLYGVTLCAIGEAFVSDITVDTAKTGLTVDINTAKSPFFSFLNISNTFTAVNILSVPDTGAYFSFCTFGTSNLLNTVSVTVDDSFSSTLNFYDCRFTGRPSYSLLSNGTGRMTFCNCTFVGWLESAIKSKDIILTAVNSSFNAGSSPLSLSDNTVGMLALCNSSDTEEENENIFIVKTDNEYIFPNDDKTLFSASGSIPSIKNTVYYAVDYGVSESSEDNSSAIQSAVNYAYRNGGGIVFLPSGQLRIKNVIKVKKGVILRGVGSSENNNMCSTVLLSNNEAGNVSSLITLESYSGVCDLSVFYYKIPDLISNETELSGNAIFAEGQSNIYVSNISLVRPANGIKLIGCSDITIRNIRGTTLERGIDLNGCENVAVENITLDSSHITTETVLAYRKQNYRGINIYGGDNIRIRNFSCSEADYSVYIDNDEISVVPQSPSVTVLGLFGNSVYSVLAVGKYSYASFINVWSEPEIHSSNAYHITTFSGNRGKLDVACLCGTGTVTGGIMGRSGNITVFASSFFALGKDAVYSDGANIVMAGCLLIDNNCTYHVEADSGTVCLLGNVTNPSAEYEGTEKKYVRKYIDDSATYADDGNIRGILP